MNLQRIYEEKTNDFIKQSLSQILTGKNQVAELTKEVQNSLTQNAEIKAKFQAKFI